MYYLLGSIFFFIFFPYIYIYIFLENHVTDVTLGLFFVLTGEEFCYVIAKSIT